MNERSELNQPLVIGGDCLAVLRSMPDNHVHAVVCDPPYGLSQVDSVKLTTALTAWVNGDRERVPGGKGFMGKEWDAFVPPPAVWDECLRVLKPGGHMLVFAGSRTVDLMGLSIRLAGFEIRDTLQWLYGSGFPKSQNISKQIDKNAGVEFSARPASGVGFMNAAGEGGWNVTRNQLSRAGESTDAAREWEGWGTALKPAAEPIILARKPLATTVAKNVLVHGTGGINVDGCRATPLTDAEVARSGKSTNGGIYGKYDSVDWKTNGAPNTGRFPANVILSHTETCDESECEQGCPVAELDAQSGRSTSPPVGSVAVKVARIDQVAKGDEAARISPNGHGDSGGASRFFPTFRYQAKAPKRERPKVDGVAHPTVKPVALMRWLVRLVTPPGGTVLDPFAGSGTTLQAAQEEGFESIGVERDEDYMKLISERLGDAA